MTLRGVALMCGAALLAALGWTLAWPELSILAGGALVAVALGVLVASGGTRVAVVTDPTTLRAVRGETATLRVELRALGRRRRLCRLVEGDARAPRRSFALPGLARRAFEEINVPVDTARRGQHPVGPFRVVRADAWSIVSRQVGVSAEGTVLVRPRIHPVRQGFAAIHRQGDSEAMTRSSGDDHFFALRDYTFGDEPRNVHWRSSARSGRLVVKQKVAAAIDGSLLVLDVDLTSYTSVDAFGAGFDESRFEAAVEVMASLCKARLGDGQRVRLMTTARVQPQASPESSLLTMIDTLAAVSCLQPLDCDVHGLPAVARRSGCSHLLVVSGAPRADMLAAVRRCGSMSPVVVRVGGVPTGPIPGASVIDIPSAEALA